MLRAYGAEVVICPTAVPPDSPESYYSVSDRLAEELPGGFKPDQYSNMANPEAHYRVTGPEIWEQTDGGQIDAIVVSVGTGGTISGVGRYFKEHRPEVLIVGADPEGSVYTARARRRRASLPRRGDRQGHVARDDGPRRRRRVGARLRPRLVRDRAAPGPRGGHPRRRVRRDDGLGGPAGRRTARPAGSRPDDDPGQRPLVPVQVLRRQLAARARLRGAARAGPHSRRGARARSSRSRARYPSSSPSPRTRRSARRST